MNRNLVLSACVALLTACATEPAKSPAPPSVSAAPAAAAPAADSVPVPEQGKGMVVFYRPSGFAGAAIGFIVREGTTELGKLRSGKYFVLQVAPGKHTYVVHSEAKDELTIDVDAGETYYIEGEVGMGILVGHPHIKPSDKSGFEAAKGKMKQVSPLSG